MPKAAVVRPKTRSGVSSSDVGGSSPKYSVSTINMRSDDEIDQADADAAGWDEQIAGNRFW